MFNFFSRFLQNIFKPKQRDDPLSDPPVEQELKQQDDLCLTQEEHISRLNHDQRLILKQALRYKDLINESLNLSSSSSNPETKTTRLELAKGKLNELQAIVSAHSYIKFQQLEETQALIKKLEAEYAEKKYYTDVNPTPYLPQPIIALGIPGDSPIIQGYRFSVTMSLRTPAYILKMHGRAVPKDDPLLSLPIRQDQGVWLAEAPPIFIGGKEIKFQGSAMASEIGPIPTDGGEYLRFLLCIRAIAEGEKSIDAKLLLLRKEMSSKRWQNIINKMSDPESMIERLFPYFLDTIPKIPHRCVVALNDHGLSTPKKILEAGDKSLLGIKGIGPARLLIIKEYCERYPDYDHERLDNVEK